MIPKIKQITASISKLQDRQDKVMQTSREVVRLAGESITQMHARNYHEARAKLRELDRGISRLKKIEKGFEYYSMQAHQEYVEAAALYSVIKTHKLPSYSYLREQPVPYLLGIMDMIGEMKRESFECMRDGEYGEARRYHDSMQRIYDSTIHMRFANSLLPNFRKKQDVARIQIESVGSELLRISSVSPFRKRNRGSGV